MSCGGPAEGLGPGVARTTDIEPYRRPAYAPDLPVHRRLQIFTSDPAASVVEGAVAEVEVPYEPLAPGPVGALFEVDCRDGVTGETYRRADLDDRHVALAGGYPPSITDPRFHQQMVYAVATRVREAFKRALGREPSWGFDRRSAEPSRLILRPHALREENAFYDPAGGEIRFGSYRAEEDSRGRNLPSGTVFTCLSHDIVAHEVTHALLDGLRSHFLVPTNRDVLAFHEGFADLVAIFERFSYPTVVRRAIEQGEGTLTSRLLTDLAGQFGQTVPGGRWALRSALAASTGDGVSGGIEQYAPELEEHQAGAVLLAAMFEAFRVVYRRKTRRIVSLVTGGGRRELRPEDLRREVVDALAERAAKLASQFLNLSIRAIDYCPPVDLRLGEYLRALVTADRDVVPEDPWGYREALIDAFRERNVYPRSVTNLSEDALLWRPARGPVPGFGSLRLDRFWNVPGDSSDAAARHLMRAALELRDRLRRADVLEALGLAAPGRTGGDEIEPPCVESVRPAYRVGPDGQQLYDVVAEVTQRWRLSGPGGFDFYGGATLILSQEGEMRYVISKSVGSSTRLEAQRDYVQGVGRGFWRQVGGRLEPTTALLRGLHAPG